MLQRSIHEVAVRSTIHEVTRGPFSYNRVQICTQAALPRQTARVHYVLGSVTVKPYTRHVALLPDIAALPIESSFLYSLSTRHSYGPWGFSNFLRLKSFQVPRYLEAVGSPRLLSAPPQLAHLPCRSMLLSVTLVSPSGSIAKDVRAIVKEGVHHFSAGMHSAAQKSMAAGRT